MRNFHKFYLQKMLPGRSNQGGCNGRGNRTHGREKMPKNFGRRTCSDETSQKTES